MKPLAACALALAMAGCGEEAVPPESSHPDLTIVFPTVDLAMEPTPDLAVADLAPPADLAPAPPMLGFAPPAMLTAPPNPACVIAADFNGDKKVDLAVNSPFASAVWVFLGHGNGTFDKGLPSSLGNNSFMEAGDFDGDGRPDLVVTAESAVNVVLGKGDGTFQPPASYQEDTLGGRFAVGDFDHNGHSDVALLDTDETAMIILLADAQGVLGQPGVFNVPRAAGGVRAAQLDANTRLDLITLDNDGSAKVYLGVGDGTFTAGQEFPAGGQYIRAGAMIDLNNDKKIDLATVNPVGSPTVGVLLGDGKGGFGAPSVVPGVNDPEAVAGADFDGDGRVDLVASDMSDGALHFFLGDGKGGFAPSLTLNGLGDGLITIAVADFNGDGKPDIAVPDYSGAAIRILINTSK